MKRVVVNKRRWLRGDDKNSMLLKLPENKMCCIGFLARELGCTRSEIAGVGTLHGVANKTARVFDGDYWNSLASAYDVNDDPHLDDDERMAKLKEIGLEMDVRFVFR